MDSKGLYNPMVGDRVQLIRRPGYYGIVSEFLPQPIFFGESDVAEHCAKCGEYLYGGEIEE